MGMRMAVVLGACCSVALAGEKPPAFTAKPVATKTAEGTVKIEFAVDRETDVAVYIENGGGKVVRHLVAGVLGKNPPAPLKPGLAQSLEWDGRDDLGQPAAGGNFKVRVGLGLVLKPDKTVGDPGALCGVRGLAVGPGGELYTLGIVGHLHGGKASPLCYVFDRGGRYLRTIMPYSSELPAGRTKGFGGLELEGQGQIPFVHNGEHRSIYPQLTEPFRQQPVVTRSGRFVLAASAKGPVLLRVEKDGGCPEGGDPGLDLDIKADSGFASLALSPDEGTLYVTGLGGPGGAGGKKGGALHAVYRVPLAGGEPKVFAGVPNEAGKDQTHLNGPCGLAVDGDGNVYVADGGFLSEVAADAPGHIAVHRKTGAIYALTGKSSSALVKISGLKDGKVVAKAELKPYGGSQHAHYRRVLAVDGEAEPAVIWVGTPNQGGVLRYEDGGAEFANVRGVSPGGLLFYDMSLDRERDVLWLRTGGPNLKRSLWIDGATGERTDFPVKVPKGAGDGGATMACGRDGRLYLKVAGSGGVYRYARDLKPEPFPNADGCVRAPKEATSYDSMHLLGRGLDVGALGTGAVLVEYRGSRNKNSGREWGMVMTFDAAGKILSPAAVDGLTSGACSPRIDSAGNIYVADCSKPEGQAVAPGLKGKVPEDKGWYPAMCGSIIKFPPTGGKLREGGGKVTVGYGGKKDTTLSGALWQRGGVSPVPLHGGVGGAYYCSCEQMRFDVDGFGRVFSPDVVRFQVTVMDTDGNAIGRYGTYGNVDDQAKGGALRFAWPLYVCAGDRAVYVGDILNRSVVRALVTYAAEETCSVR